MAKNKNEISSMADITDDHYVDQDEKETVEMLMQHEMAADGGEEQYDDEAKLKLCAQIVTRIRS